MVRIVLKGQQPVRDEPVGDALYRLPREPRAMSRRGAPPDATSAVEWVRGDLMDPVSLDAALKGVDVVVSSANGYMKETIEADFQGNENLIVADHVET